MRSPLCGLILATSCALALAIGEMNTIYEWNYIDYLWDSEAARQEAIKSGKYRFGSILPMDVDRSVGNELPNSHKRSQSICKKLKKIFHGPQTDEFSYHFWEPEVYQRP